MARIVGSALGEIEWDGDAHRTEHSNGQGGTFEGKIEGLSLHRRNGNVARFVVDDDDEEIPSKLFEAELGPAFFGP